jgi:hypothetical protein
MQDTHQVFLVERVVERVVEQVVVVDQIISQTVLSRSSSVPEDALPFPLTAASSADEFGAFIFRMGDGCEFTGWIMSPWLSNGLQAPRSSSSSPHRSG